jgi:molybdopterin-guanine dinucleotide biosynthesis protein MobB
MIPIVSIVGRSNTGKTTLIEGIIPELKKQGYRVATIKHNLHGFDVDREGKDSWRHRRAGAGTVVLAAPRSIVVFDELDREYDIKGIAENYIKNRDIIITEGFKGNPLPKIEVFRTALKQELLCGPDDNLIALAGDKPVNIGVPYFDLNDYSGIAEFIKKAFLKG